MTKVNYGNNLEKKKNKNQLKKSENKENKLNIQNKLEFYKEPSKRYLKNSIKEEAV